MGLREIKKARTRRAISSLATELFVARGYHAVTTAEIAEKAEVSVATLFNYFPVKEALVFDDDEDLESALADAVLSRPAGQSILEALREFILHGPFFCAFREEADESYARFFKLLRTTPELAAYGWQMSLRYEKALGEAISTSTGGAISPVRAAAIAHFVLQAIHRAQLAPHPIHAFNELMDLIISGTEVHDPSWTTRCPA